MTPTTRSNDHIPQKREGPPLLMGEFAEQG